MVKQLSQTLTSEIVIINQLTLWFHQTWLAEKPPAQYSLTYMVQYLQVRILELPLYQQTMCLFLFPQGKQRIYRQRMSGWWFGTFFHLLGIIIPLE